MPTYRTPASSAPTPASKVYRTPAQPTAPQPSAPSEESSIDPWLAGAGAAALGAGVYALTRNPGVLKTLGTGAMDLRRMSMLSGLAPLKSLLGNVGGSVYGSIERGSLAPLKEMLSPETLKDAVATFRANPSYANAGPATGITKFNLPGRLMGSFDTAAQNALKRAGYTAEEAEASMLQSPVPERLAKGLDNPVMNYLVPFRRTPINQFIEGGKTFAPKTRGQALALGTSLASGAATGASVDDPKTIGLGTALSGRYGLPFTLAAGVTRALTSGSKAKGAEAIQGASPFSDYSLAEGTLNPVMGGPEAIVPKLAAISAYSYLRKLLGMD